MIEYFRRMIRLSNLPSSLSPVKLVQEYFLVFELRFHSGFPRLFFYMYMYMYSIVWGAMCYKTLILILMKGQSLGSGPEFEL